MNIISFGIAFSVSQLLHESPPNRIRWFSIFEAQKDTSGGSLWPRGVVHRRLPEVLPSGRGGRSKASERNGAGMHYALRFFFKVENLGHWLPSRHWLIVLAAGAGQLAFEPNEAFGWWLSGGNARLSKSLCHLDGLSTPAASQSNLVEALKRPQIHGNATFKDSYIVVFFKNVCFLRFQDRSSRKLEAGPLSEALRSAHGVIFEGLTLALKIRRRSNRNPQIHRIIRISAYFV